MEDKAVAGLLVVPSTVLLEALEVVVAVKIAVLLEVLVQQTKVMLVELAVEAI